jgi:hypothetical protein
MAHGLYTARMDAVLNGTVDLSAIVQNHDRSFTRTLIFAAACILIFGGLLAITIVSDPPRGVLALYILGMLATGLGAIVLGLRTKRSLAIEIPFTNKGTLSPYEWFVKNGTEEKWPDDKRLDRLIVRRNKPQGSLVFRLVTDLGDKNNAREAFHPPALGTIFHTKGTLKVHYSGKHIGPHITVRQLGGKI